jgi:hypothetical protein
MYFLFAVFLSRHFLLIDVLSMSTFFPVNVIFDLCFLLFDVLSQSTFFIFYVLSQLAFFPFNVLSHSAIFLLTFCPLMFFTVDVFYFDVLSVNRQYSEYYSSMIRAAITKLNFNDTLEAKFHWW